MECPSCRAPNAADAIFCDECGARLDWACPSCGEGNRLGAKFCKKCGQSLARAAAPASRFDSPEAYTPKHLAEKILTSKSAVEGERKQVTVLFADLKGSMELLADRDPEEARRLLDPVLERMMDAVHRYEGTVNQVMGDGIMALFGAPLAHEDHAVRACYAALRMQESVTAYAEEIRRGGGALVQIRVGLNSGEVVVRAIGSDLHMDYTAVGQTTHLAARMEQIARPGGILATPETVRLAEGYVETRSLGPIPVKGREAPIEVYEIVAAAPVRSRLQAAAARGLTRFVGRDRELAAIGAAFARAASGRGQVVAIAGKAGVGKSRLFYEFVHGSAAAGWLVLEAGAVSYGKSTPYLPVVDLLKSYFKIESGDGVEAIQTKVAGRVEAALNDVIAPLLALLDVLPEMSPFRALDPRERRERTLEAISRLLVREARRQPVLLVVENLEWIDSETQAVLDGLVDGLAAVPMLLLLAHRPEYQHRWQGRDHYTGLAIEPLSAAEAERLLASFLGEAPELGPLKALLIERTAGNPFFLEESLRTLVETGALSGERGAYHLARDVRTLEIPPNVQAIVASRIDRLAPEDKRLLQCASVVGRDFRLALVAAIAGLPEDHVHQGLSRLQDSEFIEHTSPFPEPEYIFVHALTHEVAYASLLQDQRRSLHAKIAETIETLYAPRLAAEIERLAHHAFQGEVWDKAVAYSRRAGAKATERAANREAVVCFEQALKALDRLPQSRERIEHSIDLRLDLRPPLLQLGRLQDVLTVSREAEALAKELGDEPRLAGVYTYLINYHYLKGEPHLALEYGERCLAIANAGHDARLQTLAARYMGHIYHAQGEYRRAVEVLRENVERLEGLPDADVVSYVASAGWLAFALSEIGEFEPAQAYLDRAQRAADQARHAYSQAIAWTMAGIVWTRRGYLEQAVQPLERSLEACRAKHLTVWQPIPSSLLGRALVLLGRTDEGLQLLRTGVALTEELGVKTCLALWTSHLAEGLLAAGEMEEALLLAERAQDLAFAHGEPGHQAWSLRLIGDIVSRGEAPDLEKVEAAYREALLLGEDLGMRPLIAHCHLGLGRVYRLRGERAKAEEHVTTATAEFWEMGMRFWLRESERELTALGQLFIVARDNPGLCDWLTRELFREKPVKVILDRRRGDRRQRSDAKTPERRRVERRRGPSSDARLRSQGFVIIE